MSQFYTDPSREADPFALPDGEVFFIEANSCYLDENDSPLEEGWYWQICAPGCLPDYEPTGPFETKEDAIADAIITDD